MDIPKSRWGWAAIHLCNLYSGKLDDSDRALALLQRVASECSETTAGQKARDRLAKIAAGEMGPAKRNEQWRGMAPHYFSASSIASSSFSIGCPCQTTSPSFTTKACGIPPTPYFPM